MTLVKISEPTDPINCPKETYGCGQKYVFEEDDYQISAGTKSGLIICFGAPVVGLQFLLYGHTFTMVAVAPANDHEIQQGASPAITAANTIAALQAIPFFFDNYDISPIANPDCLDVRNKNFGVDENFSWFSENEAFITGIYSSSPQGRPPTYKSNYYIFGTVTDVETGDVICSDWNLPLNIYADGLQNRGCLNLEGLLRNYPRIYTSPPDPLSGNAAFDTNMVKQFEVSFVGKYIDPTDGCTVIDTNTLNCPNINFVNSIRQPENPVGFEKFCNWPLSAPETVIEITNRPAGYTICKDTFFEIRYWFPQNLLSSQLFPIYWFGAIIYADGSNFVGSGTWAGQPGEIHVYNFNPSDFNFPAPVDMDADWDRVQVQMFIDLGGMLVPMTELIVLNFERNLQGVCCGCHTNFMFVSESGANDVFKASCINSQSLKLEFSESCRVQRCGEFLGGRVNTGVSLRDKEERVFIDTPDVEYLEQFLASPIKYLMDGNNVWRIIPTDAEYNIYKKGQRNRVEFTYKRSRIKHNYTT